MGACVFVVCCVVPIQFQPGVQVHPVSAATLLSENTFDSGLVQYDQDGKFKYQINEGQMAVVVTMAMSMIWPYMLNHVDEINSGSSKLGLFILSSAAKVLVSQYCVLPIKSWTGTGVSSTLSVFDNQLLLLVLQVRQS